ncbi:hypothetical protein B0T26DRAFT_670478 [Lasiosphaeria miniovina]|uniref:Uncharacterized protein n=1 Tax=Lasiosphaeria miniovina TaxID=1954250 RepID=A0AA40BH51_9PEZI|nr:uncharacterized protein B0T26DRAFT_670478 [Lasiosphaeria miniovina]KAK0734146.1 hypothetical protein B0T26DRAFT_670478 [Lasiosphaeria miniovina]
MSHAGRELKFSLLDLRDEDIASRYAFYVTHAAGITYVSHLAPYEFPMLASHTPADVCSIQPGWCLNSIAIELLTWNTLLSSNADPVSFSKAINLIPAVMFMSRTSRMSITFDAHIFPGLKISHKRDNMEDAVRHRFIQNQICLSLSLFTMVLMSSAPAFVGRTVTTGLLLHKSGMYMPYLSPYF